MRVIIKKFFFKLNDRRKRFLVILGISLLISNTFVLYFTFLSAYFNGFKVIVNINNFGEADFEAFIFIPLCIVLGFYALKYNLRNGD